MTERLVVREGEKLISVERERVHCLGLLHYCVHLICYREGSVFLQRRREDRPRNGGLWTSTVSGHVASEDVPYLAEGITPGIGVIAVKREFMEELGYPPPPGVSAEYVGEVQADSRGGGEVCNCRSLIFRMNVTSLPPASSPEVDEIGLFRWEDVIAAIEHGGTLQGRAGQRHALADNFAPVFREFLRASVGQPAAVR